MEITGYLTTYLAYHFREWTDELRQATDKKVTTFRIWLKMVNILNYCIGWWWEPIFDFVTHIWSKSGSTPRSRFEVRYLNMFLKRRFPIFFYKYLRRLCQIADCLEDAIGPIIIRDGYAKLFCKHYTISLKVEERPVVFFYFLSNLSAPCTYQSGPLPSLWWWAW